MRLYLDLQKAAAQPTGGTTTKKEEQAVAEDAESYVETTSGVSGGSASYDDPKVGRKWKHDDDDSLDDEVEEQRQRRNARAQARNLVPTKEEIGIKKAFDETAIDMVKSLTSGLRDVLKLNTLTASEIDFLHTVKGYSLEEIKKGQLVIAGRDRNAFSEFLCQKVSKSLDNLYRK